MSLIVVGLAAAAAAGVGGWLAARSIKKRRARANAQTATMNEDGTAAPPPPPPNPLEGWPLTLGDVVQFGEQTRWLRSAVLARTDEGLRCALMLSDEGATVAMAPPERDLYWLKGKTMTLPPSPPARIEIDGLLLDRRMSLPVSLQVIGDEPPAVDTEGVISLYLGSVGDAAVVLESGETHLWHGQRLEPGDYDNLGHVED